MDAALSSVLSVLVLPAWQAPGWALAVAWLAVPLLALTIDHRWGEPPVRLHPVVWMGRALQWAGDQWAPRAATAHNWKVFGLFALVWSAFAAIVFVLFALLQCALAWLPLAVAVPLAAVLLKPLLAWRMLRGEVLAVEGALARSLPAGRAQLSRLVSRDVHALTAEEVRESAIESLAENLNDSVVAPLFWFALLGLPGAALYRWANTADAMWGYPGLRGGRHWQWAGKWAARADDGLSWLPARITAWLLLAGARRLWLAGLSSEARKTPSPNSGWPMAAMALALGVQLRKPGVYALNALGRSPGPPDVGRAAALAARALWLGVPVLAAWQMLVWVVASRAAAGWAP